MRLNRIATAPDARPIFPKMFMPIAPTRISRTKIVIVGVEVASAALCQEGRLC